MSTKVYYGLKLTKEAPPLLDMGAALTPVVRPVFEKRYLLLLALHWTTAMDDKPVPEGGLYYGSLMYEIQSKIKAADQSYEKDYLYGVDFSVTFLKGTAKRTLAWPCFQNSEYFEALKETGWFEEYGYWDNTDPEEGVSARAWTARGKEWASAMGPNYRAIDRGLTWEYKPLLALDFSASKVDWDTARGLSMKDDSAWVAWCDSIEEKSKKLPW